MKRLKSIIMVICVIATTIMIVNTIGLIQLYFSFNSNYQEVEDHPWVIDVIEGSLISLEYSESSWIGFEHYLDMDILKNDPSNFSSGTEPKLKDGEITNYTRIFNSSDYINAIMEDLRDRDLYDFEKELIRYDNIGEAYEINLALIDFFAYYGELAVPQEEYENILNLLELQRNFLKTHVEEDLDKNQYMDFLQFHYLNNEFLKMILKTTIKNYNKYGTFQKTSRDEFQAYIRRFNDFLALEENKNIIEELSNRYGGGN